jgi:lipopolysaccharide transport system ATP-binding protein
MKEKKIMFNNVNLHYSLVAHNARSLLTQLIAGFGRGGARPSYQDVHALKNVTLAIEQGERIGLIGHNGAGKSTFLKAVAGLYPISSGEALVEGEVRALFDLSMGFEPDATGRENIFYRGLLLGLSPQTVREKESEIIEFADLGEFIDYPIRTYSAGMQVRLAFAITTSVSGSILLLDEIIGAGDANFMVKARQRIRELIDQAEILILASHDFSSLKSICDRGIVFHAGEVIYDGPIETAVAEYSKANSE